jgi:serine/threonine-protein kinase
MRAKLLDFGIAKWSDTEASAGHALGTPAYMAPEQATAAPVSPRTDVWAMGVLLFRCLSGKLPFDAADATGMLFKVVHERAPLFGAACPDLGPHLALVLDRALEPRPEARPATMREFARAIALACRQDGIALPNDPDPVGLPAFSTWLAEADIERTQPATPTGIIAEPTGVSLIEPRIRPKRSRGLRTAVAVFAALVLLGAWLVLARQEGPRARAAHAAAAPPNHPAPSVAPPTVESSKLEPSLAAPIALPAEPAPESPSAKATPVGSPKRNARRGKDSTRIPARTTVNDVAPAGRSALIKQWDW